ncbi:hypothetical protein AUK40_02525 [Candidatus Wirthbacteria bacterium CG2_30_54_11]|uniref:Uncharacterized protein n=1 Tax=Candidatus Wirthbacteria bacterium CG2_30_54_11 TaxID=1817892 RepID=A0A1J5IZT7_9BACT|nr:MAG: hypothetical protein AUK40_02525 [Candidatus Wirthbacteria bacterium CG2_30_54_11]
MKRIAWIGNHLLLIALLVLLGSSALPSTAWGTGAPVSPLPPLRPPPLNPGDGTVFLVTDLQYWVTDLETGQAQFFAGAVNGGRTYAEYDSLVSSTLSIMTKMEDGQQYVQVFQRFPPDISQEGYLMYLLLQNSQYGDDSFNAFRVVKDLLKAGKYDEAYYLTYYVINATDAWKTANAPTFAKAISSLTDELRALGVANVALSTDDLSLIPVVFEDLLRSKEAVGSFNRIGITKLGINNLEGSVTRLALLPTTPEAYAKVALHEWTHACTTPACYLPASTDPLNKGTWYKELIADRMEWRVSKNLGWVDSLERPLGYVGAGYPAINDTHIRLIREQVMRELGSSYSKDAFELLYDTKERELLKLILSGQATEDDLARIYGRSFDVVNSEFILALKADKSVTGVLASNSDELMTLVERTRVTKMAGTTGPAAETFVDEVVETVPNAVRLKDTLRPLWRGTLKILNVVGKVTDVIMFTDMLGGLAESNWDVTEYLAPVTQFFLPNGYRHPVGDEALVPLQEGTAILMPDMVEFPEGTVAVEDMIAPPVQVETYVLTDWQYNQAPGDAKRMDESFWFRHYFGGSGNLLTESFVLTPKQQIATEDHARVTVFVPNRAVYTDDFPPVASPTPVPGYDPWSALDAVQVGEVYVWELLGVGSSREALFGNATILYKPFEEFILPILGTLLFDMSGIDYSLIEPVSGGTAEIQAQNYSTPVARFKIVSAQSMTKSQYDDWVENLDREAGALAENEWQSETTGQTSTAPQTMGAPLTPPLSLPLPNPTIIPVPAPPPPPAGLTPFVGIALAAEEEELPSEIQFFANGAMGKFNGGDFQPLAVSDIEPTEAVAEDGSPSPDCLYFPLGETMPDGLTGTGHFLCNTAEDGTSVYFREYYDQNNGSTALGAPLDEMAEQDDGIWVQHFQNNELRCDNRIEHVDGRNCGVTMLTAGVTALIETAYRGEIKDDRYGTLIGELDFADETMTSWLGIPVARAQMPAVTLEQWLSPLSRVTASGAGGTFHAYFDENGHFALVVPDGRYTVSIAIAGFKTLKLPWTVRAGNTDVVFFAPEAGSRAQTGGSMLIIPFGDMESKATIGLGALGIIVVLVLSGGAFLAVMGLLATRAMPRRL